MKKLICLAAAALACIAALSSCGWKVAPDAAARYELLQGTWESVHVEGHDYSTDAGTGESIYHADFDEDIPGPSHERYMKMRLDRNNMVTVLEMGDPEDLTLPASFSYTFDGSRLGGVVFSGDYADYMNIISIDGDSMVLELVDKGQDEETIDDCLERMTFNRVNE